MLAWLGFVQPVNVGLYFMAGGTAEEARLGATWRRRVIMLSVRVAKTATLGGVAPLNLAIAEKVRLSDWYMRSSYVPNTNLSGSCVPNSGFRREKLFLKWARHRRRLRPVEPHIQQRLLYCTQAWPRASTKRNGVCRDESVLTMLFVTVHTIA